MGGKYEVSASRDGSRNRIGLASEAALHGEPTV